MIYESGWLAVWWWPGSTGTHTLARWPGWIQKDSKWIESRVQKAQCKLTQVFWQLQQKEKHIWCCPHKKTWNYIAMLVLSVYSRQMQCSHSSCGTLYTMVMPCWCRTHGAACWNVATKSQCYCCTHWVAGPKKMMSRCLGASNSTRLSWRIKFWTQTGQLWPSSRLLWCMQDQQR